jgi:hypothetical protein
LHLWHYPPVKRAPLIAVLALLAVAVALPMTGGQLGFGGDPSADPGASPSGAALAPTATADAPRSTPAASAGGEATPLPTVAPTDPPLDVAEAAIVPVVHFRSTATRATRAEVTAVLEGTSERYDAL